MGKPPTEHVHRVHDWNHIGELLARDLRVNVANLMSGILLPAKYAWKSISAFAPECVRSSPNRLEL